MPIEESVKNVAQAETSERGPSRNGGLEPCAMRRLIVVEMFIMDTLAKFISQFKPVQAPAMEGMPIKAETAGPVCWVKDGWLAAWFGYGDTLAAWQSPSGDIYAITQTGVALFYGASAAPVAGWPAQEAEPVHSEVPPQVAEPVHSEVPPQAGEAACAEASPPPGDAGTVDGTAPEEPAAGMARAATVEGDPRHGACCACNHCMDNDT